MKTKQIDKIRDKLIELSEMINAEVSNLFISFSDIKYKLQQINYELFEIENRK